MSTFQSSTPAAASSSAHPSYDPWLRRIPSSKSVGASKRPTSAVSQASTATTCSSHYTLAPAPEAEPLAVLHARRRSVTVSAGVVRTPAQQLTFAFERVAARASPPAPPRLQIQPVASGSGSGSGLAVPSPTTPTLDPERGGYVRVRALSTQSSLHKAKPAYEPIPSTHPYGSLGLKSGSALHPYGGLPRQRAHSSFSPSCPLPMPHAIVPPLPPAHPLAERRGTIGPKPLSLAVPTKSTNPSARKPVPSLSGSQLSSPAVTPTTGGAASKRRYVKPEQMDVHSPLPTSPSAFFDALQEPAYDSASDSSSSSESEDEEESEEFEETGGEYTPLPRSPFITSPLGPGLQFRAPSPMSPSQIPPAPFSAANYPDPCPSPNTQASSGGFWRHAKAARSTPTIASSRKSLFSPAVAAFSPTFAKFASRGIFGRKRKGKPVPHISSPIPVHIPVLKSPRREMGSESASSAASSAYAMAPMSPGARSQFGPPSPLVPNYPFVLSPAAADYPPSPVTPLSPLSPGLLPAGHGVHSPPPLSPELLSHERESRKEPQERDANEKALEKEARRGLKRDKDGRVSAWITSQLSLSLLPSSADAALEYPEAPRSSADTAGTGSVKELEGMLVQHMSDERARFKRLAGSVKSSMSQGAAS
ncbi:hypothetical protein HWV62_29997 [Athelia sp. TMB]|nr:hypothetical protein HWV62_29997 [Athelia sp. TMB]